MTAAERLLSALQDPVHLVRQNAAEGLGMIGAPVVGLLLAQVQDGSTSELQHRLADTLARLRDPEAVDVLSAALNYLEPPARYGAAEALGSLGLPAGVPALIQTLESTDPVSRQKSAQALLEIGSPEAVHALIVLLADPDPRMRELAVRGLGKIEDEASVLSLLSALEDPDETVRLATEAALAGISKPGLAPIMLTSLNSSSAFALRAIAHTLGSYPDPQVIDRLQELMSEDGDLRTRLTAAESLTRLGDDRGSAMILRTLNAPNQETRRVAAIALGMTGDPRAVEPLIESARRGAFDAATPDGRRQRRRMFEAMAAVGEPILPPLVELLASRDPAVRGFAADALAQMGSTAVGPLAKALRLHPDLGARTAAARVLGRLRDRDAVEPLMDVLRETLTGPFPLVFLLRLFADGTAPVRAAAAAAIGEIGGLDGAGLLLSAARYDPAEEVNAAAEAALARSGAPAVIARLAQPDVSRTINRALAAGLALLLAGFLTGSATRLWGPPGAVMLTGLSAAGVLGLADGLEGRRRPIRLALLGCLAGAAGAWLAGLAGLPDRSVILIAALFPMAGALAGWSRTVPIQRLAGLFGGVVLGVIGAGAAALILGTIGR